MTRDAAPPLPVQPLGDWMFDPAAAELRRGDERRRLEDRAARTLELLCRRRGEVVSQETLVEQVWGGRALSANSVAVVIGDLRRALGDDARQPRYIETVAKRGYRLIAPGAAEPAAATPAPPRRRMVWAAAAAVAVLGVAALAWVRVGPQAAAPVTVVVEDVTNATGDPAYDALARSVTDVMLAHMAAAEGVRVVRRPDRDAAATLGGRLVIWSGHPAMGMTALDPDSGEVLWSAMASGPESQLPRQIGMGVGQFTARLAASETDPVRP